MPQWLAPRLRKAPGVTGTFVQTPCTAVVEVLADFAFDFLCIEAEHSAYSVREIEHAVLAAERHDMSAIIRVAGNDPVLIAQALDAGVAGVVVPRIESAAAASAAVSAARYPPGGSRGCGPGRASSFGRRLGAYVGHADRNLLVALQVETRDAVERLDEILAVPGIDLIFVGPNDLAMSYRSDPEGPSADVEDVVQAVFEKTKAAGIATGIFAATAQAARRWQDFGVDLVIVGSDLMFLAAGAEVMLDALGGQAGPRPDSPGSEPSLPYQGSSE